MARKVNKPHAERREPPAQVAARRAKFARTQRAKQRRATTAAALSGDPDIARYREERAKRLAAGVVLDGTSGRRPLPSPIGRGFVVRVAP